MTFLGIGLIVIGAALVCSAVILRPRAFDGADEEVDEERVPKSPAAPRLRRSGTG